jgi:predicted transcriptional regulator
MEVVRTDTTKRQNVQVQELQAAVIDQPLMPPQVEHLPAREREVALMIYGEGPATARALEERLDRELSNSALRCMLGRLCKKGILSRRKLLVSRSRTDRRVPYEYAPAILSNEVRGAAIRQLAQDYFDGSLLLVAREAIALLNDERPAERMRPSLQPQRTKLAA